MDEALETRLAGVVDLDRLDAAIWIYDFDARRVVWANAAGLALWNSGSRAELAARDLGLDASPGVARRLLQHQDVFVREPRRELRELWTLYPQGAPLAVRAALRGHRLSDGRMGMLVEARPIDALEVETLRAADALQHTEVMTAVYAWSGDELYANPALVAALAPERRTFGRCFVRACDRLAFEAGLKATRKHKAVVAVRARSGERWWDVRATSCQDAASGVAAFLISATDVTALQEHEHALAAARDAAEAASRSKSQFLATMSHEMRTPLNGVLGMAELVGAGALDDRQRKQLEILRHSGETLLALIEDAMDLARLDLGAISPRPDAFRPAELAGQVHAFFREAAEAKELSLAVVSDLPEDMVHVSDPRLVSQALRHLVANAVKFTEHGRVETRVSRGMDGAVRLEVADEGPGVAEDEREAIFARFSQADQSATRSHGGTGLGLSLAADIARLIGGSITYVDGPLGGACFRLVIPPLQLPPPQAGSHSVEEPALNVRRLRAAARA